MIRRRLAATLVAAALAGPAGANGLLSATVYAAPAFISIGQQASVFVDIMNVGGPEAVQFVTPSDALVTSCAGVTNRMALTEPTYVSYVSGPAPSCTAYLNPNQHAYFTWAYAGSATGYEVFTVTVTGQEASGALATVSAQDSDGLTVAFAAKLSATPTTDPPLVGRYGQCVTLYLAVENVGQGTADNVQAYMPSLAGTASMSYLGCTYLGNLGPDCPSTSWPIPPGTSAIFTWLYLDTAPGAVTFTMSAFGRDHSTGNAIVSVPKTAVLTVPLPAVLSISVTGTVDLVQGQSFRLKVHAANLGATAVCQSGLDVFIGGSAAPILSVVPELHDLHDTMPVICYEPGQVREFTLLVTLRQDALLGSANLTVVSRGHEEWTMTPAISTGAPMAVTIYSRRPGLAAITPNPFHPAVTPVTRITFVVSPDQNGLPVSVKVYSLSGELVRTLVDEALPAGVYDAVWDGRNRGRQPVAGGIVLVLYEGLGKKDIRKLAVIK